MVTLPQAVLSILPETGGGAAARVTVTWAGVHAAKPLHVSAVYVTEVDVEPEGNGVTVTERVSAVIGTPLLDVHRVVASVATDDGVQPELSVMEAPAAACNELDESPHPVGALRFASTTVVRGAHGAAPIQTSSA
ncbi:MAG: hypothetical protein EAZ43_01875 [Betaproteobacteria bacterium]|nr:MAG: hypothetical protein EAZ43_01875 [Betaproteobacteria bacterium]